LILLFPKKRIGAHTFEALLQFFQAASFNKDIGDWDVSSVTEMSGMVRVIILRLSGFGLYNTRLSSQPVLFKFYFATEFDRDIGNWNVASVTRMLWMVRKNGQCTQQQQMDDLLTKYLVA
jgi:surface protein